MAGVEGSTTAASHGEASEHGNSNRLLLCFNPFSLKPLNTHTHKYAPLLPLLTPLSMYVFSLYVLYRQSA